MWLKYFVCILTVFSISGLAVEIPRIVPNIKVLPSQISQVAHTPYYSESEGALYYVDSVAKEYIRLDVESGTATKYSSTEKTSIIIPYADEPGTFIVSSGIYLLKLNWETGEVTTIADGDTGHGLDTFEYAKCDSMGRLIVSTTHWHGNGLPVPFSGSMYRLDGNEFVLLDSGFTVSGAMSWSRTINGTYEDFYFSDPTNRQIWKYRYIIGTGKIENRFPWITFEGNPDFADGEYSDGQAMDANGYLWVAVRNGSRVVKIDPITARVVDEIKFERVQQPTALTFGNYKNEFGFYLTSASVGMNPILDNGKILHVSFQGTENYKFRPSSKITHSPQNSKVEASKLLRKKN
jgi:sugar lactone lactonase YvrE